MKKISKAVTLTAAGTVLPYSANAQSLGDEMNSLHGVLEQLYDEMMPLCSNLLGVGQGIAGFAALWYIASRVWRHLASAEPIDFYPLFRPFVIGFCIMIFPSVLAMINGIMKPTVTATAAMVEGSNKAIEVLLQKKEEAIKTTDVWQMYVGEDGSGDEDRWYKYTHDGDDPDDQGLISGIGTSIKFAMAKAAYNFQNSVKEWMSEVLRVLFEAASLCIDTLRTFQLVVLSILGPLVFGLSVFDGFQHTLTAWLARYINIYLWLPVANIFGSIIGKIQEKMLMLDIEQVNDYGDTFFSKTDMAYLAFMIIGITGYFTVPSVANYIVQAGGSGLSQKVTSLFNSGSSSAIHYGNVGGGAFAERFGSGLVNMAHAPLDIMDGYQNGGQEKSGGHQHDKLKGNS
ncbi:conjugal transfer protein TraJ [Flavobacterium subsaxonicum WB 4.1-42 = DSM 21790]|uniref:Conjugal transfer protein TraJ n=2 Tax=Flavobacterium TaxID=237 RepID=A0A0A2MN12_9FLAO|nr:conjugative transposon protein TraJ [Flavobacterium subsaxonicum]KGO93674.1 conjugal transfer protein TraJ [Flavobacterium subsaxonicum WB 4.1-42 = DSM 21790]